MFSLLLTFRYIRLRYIVSFIFIERKIRVFFKRFTLLFAYKSVVIFPEVTTVFLILKSEIQTVSYSWNIRITSCDSYWRYNSYFSVPLWRCLIRTELIYHYHSTSVLNSLLVSGKHWLSAWLSNNVFFKFIHKLLSVMI